jgi:putative phosphoesterase
VTRAAALYDVHGNLPALEAVLHEVRAAGVDQVVIGGDVLPGPMPRETIDCLLHCGLPLRFIRGNGDRAVIEEMQGIESTLPEHVRRSIRWNAEQLGDPDRRMIEAWPETLRLEIDGIGRVLFCHATPRSDTEVFTRLTPGDRLLPVFSGLDAALVVCGHTHMQFDRQIGGVRVVNAGSVGMPYGDTRASWLLLGPGVELRRTPYDLTAAAERIRRTRYPQAEELIANDLLNPRSEQEMLELFARVELR